MFPAAALHCLRTLFACTEPGALHPMQAPAPAGRGGSSRTTQHFPFIPTPVACAWRTHRSPPAIAPFQEKTMTRKTWFVTGAASRLGADIVRQALAAGHCVVATDADPLAALQRIGAVADDRLLALPLDEVDAYEVGVAVKAAVARFGRVDVLVHGAAACSPQGEFEAPAARRDFSAAVRALFNVTRGVLEAMREQQAGRIHHLVPPRDRQSGPALFSIAGFCDAVGADVAPFGIAVSAVEAHRVQAMLWAASGSGSDRGEVLEEA
jgi:NAD(P)-dependent dehydrogenase (short-subunit alcohol dehydrogenase family)